VETENPYEPSETATQRIATTPRPLRPPLVLSGVLLLIGACFLLLLNGQVFTNTLVFLGLCAASALLWIRFVSRSERNRLRRLAWYVVFGHIVLIVALVPGLRHKYAWQKGFNAKMESLQN
jgi:hypothetical protein